MMRDINLGIEIEGILNRELNNIEIGNYHEGVPVRGLRNWKAEQDSSLEHNQEFGENSTCVEFVSPV